MSAVLRGDDAAVIVVGGGHAGFEAALASARLGAQTLLVTGDPERICTLACNPSIGGSAKGQLVREIDALGGEMGRVTDRVSLHARFLNESKGPSVRALRALADKPNYARVARETIAAQPQLGVVHGMVDDLIVESGAIAGVVLSDGRTLRAPNVILATGTFLGGKTFRGDDVRAEGRFGETPALGLSAALARLGFPLARLKTGTPPRVARDSVDTSQLTMQRPSPSPLRFSYTSPPAFAGPQLPCWLVETNERTHALVRDNLHRSPLYGLALIAGIGPRYCPSIEDKVVKFRAQPDAPNLRRTRRLGRADLLHRRLLHVASGRRAARDAAHLTRLRQRRDDARRIRGRIRFRPAHRTRCGACRRAASPGSFTAVNSTGPAATKRPPRKGSWPGINAAQRAHGRAPLHLGRETSYIGVLIDDLVTRGVDEPYRMLTSRAEHRVILRHDNADTRLTPVGRSFGLVDDAAWAAFEARRDAIAAGTAAAHANKAPKTIGRVNLSTGSSVADALRRPDLTFADLRDHLTVDDEAAARIEIELKMDGYVRRQLTAIERAAHDEAKTVPVDLDYAAMGALSLEAREKLSRVRPRSLGAARRIPGITPNDISVVSIHLHRLTATA